VLTEEDLHYLLALNPGERMVSAWPEPVCNSIVIGIEGDETTDLPEIAPGMESAKLDRPLSMVKLRDTLRGLVAEHFRQEGELSDECFGAIGRKVVAEVFPTLSVNDPPRIVP
jgi:hypothetical protein